MNSTLSFDSSADSKNFLKDKVMPFVKKAVKVIRDPITGRILQGACGAATIATAGSVGGAAPAAAIICGAAAIQGAISR